MKETVDRLHIIDILKGLAIVFVIITHYDWENSKRAAMLFPFWIEMAVPIFMIISGYVQSLSYETRKTNSLSEMYSYKIIIEKIIRYTAPFIIAYMIETIYQIVNKKFSIKGFIGLFFIGGLGPGSYYYPIMIQFVFVFPVIHQLIKKYDFYGLVGCFIFNFIFELLKYIYGMPSSEYRLLIFRYVGLIASGSYLLVGKKSITKTFKVVSLIVGMLWIFLINYLRYEPIIINKDWAGTSFISAFYITPIFEYVIKKYNSSKNIVLETIGKASYNVFLTQMVYFTYAEHITEEYFINNILLINIFNITTCVIIGLFFIA